MLYATTSQAPGLLVSPGSSMNMDIPELIKAISSRYSSTSLGVIGYCSEHSNGAQIG